MITPITLYILSVVFSVWSAWHLLKVCDFYVNNGIFFVLTLMTPVLNTLIGLRWMYEVYLYKSLRKGIKG